MEGTLFGCEQQLLSSAHWRFWPLRDGKGPRIDSKPSVLHLILLQRMQKE